MSLTVPYTLQVATIQDILSVDLKLKLYANNYTPGPSSVIASFTEVSGGGYTAIDLLTADWIYTAAGITPVVARQAMKTFSFTGATGGSGAVYGYYVTNVAGSVLYWAEALPGTVVPFTPANGAAVRVVPIFTISGGV